MNNNSNAILSTLAVVIVVLLIGFAFWQNYRPETSREGEIQTGAVLGSQTVWPQYVREDLLNGYGFSLRHPAGLEVGEPVANIVEFSYQGPNNEPATEITDGFSFSVQLESKPPVTTLSAYAESLPATPAVNPELVERAVAGREAISFSSVNELGNEVENLIIALDEATVAHVSYSILGDTDDIYQNTVEEIINSLEFTNGNIDSDDEAANGESVQLALLAEPVAGAEPEAGCDRVVLQSFPRMETGAPLGSALRQLFALEEETVEGYNNFIARTNNTLTFERATITDGVASIYLQGSLSGLRGVCDSPRAAIQIRETALQFPTVDRVQLYLNGEATDLVPSGRGEV